MPIIWTMWGIEMKFSGFMNVYLLDDMSWEYQFADRSLKAATLEEQPSGIEKEGYGQGFGMEGNRQGPGI